MESRQEVDNLKQSNLELSQQLDQSQETIQDQVDRIQSLNSQLDSLQKTVKSEQQKNAEAQQLQQQLVAQLSYLQQVTNRQQARIIELEQSSTAPTEAAEISPKSPQAALLLTLLIPIVFGTIPFLRKIKTGWMMLTRSEPPNNYVLLTEEEIRDIINKRTRRK